MKQSLGLLYLCMPLVSQACAASHATNASIVAHTGEPIGEEIKFGNTTFYITGKQSNTAVLYLTDVFGIQLAENKLHVRGKPAPVDLIDPGFNMTGFLYQNRPEVIDPILKSSVEFIRERFSVNNIVATGYCFGGRYAFRLLSEGRHVKAAFAAHPSLLEDGEISNITGPVSVAAAETDDAMPVERRHEIEEQLLKTEQTYSMSLYSGTMHGFGVRANVSDPDQRFAKEAAFFQAAMTDGSKFQVLSFNGAGAELHSVKKRKFHQKVTSGCLACRKKKVKCDELKPVCLRCSRNRRLCQYGRQEERDKNVVERTQQPSPSYLSAITLLPFSASSPPDGTSTINLIQYLWQNWTNITNVDCRPETKDLFKSDPTVRAVMLALTATHIRQQVPAHRPHRITELFHRSLALEKYREQLQALKRVPDQKGVNSLFISATFLNLLTFAHHESEALPAQKIMDPESSWLFSPREDRLNWLVLQTGLRPLMLSMNEYFTEGVKFTSMIFTGKYTDRWTFAHLIESLEGVPGHWIEFLDWYPQLEVASATV
uniref:Zn(2)-C6 fungal-type domain-containing protein n=1 Tax=Bionectria ochroleuca TaxID=29856 RepID=A0A8H7TQ34_BIOOC